MSSWESLTTRRGNRPKFMGRRSYTRKATNAKAKAKLEAKEPLATVAIRKANRVNSILKLQSEIRFKDVFAASTAPSTANIVLLNGMNVGDSGGQREADNVVIKSVRVNGGFVGADSTNAIRVMLVIDKQPNGATFSLSDLLETTTFDAIYAYRKTVNKARFTVLYDRKYALSGNNTSLTGRTFGLFNISIPLNLKSWYFNNVGDISDIKSNALYLVFLSDSTTVSHPVFTYAARIKYVA